MGATFHDNKMELMTDVHTFYRRVGILNYYKEVEWLGFYLINLTGIFDESHVDSLLDFCVENPEYHIVTVTHVGQLENRYVPNKRLYYLASGDKNPCLVLNPFVKEHAELFAERMYDEAFAMISDINGGNDGE